MKAILALDSGTTNVKAILVDRQGNVLARYSVPLSIEYPKSGWVEQSAAGVWEAARKAVEGCLAQGAEEIARFVAPHEAFFTLRLRKLSETGS